VQHRRSKHSSQKSVFSHAKENTSGPAGSKDGIRAPNYNRSVGILPCKSSQSQELLHEVLWVHDALGGRLTFCSWRVAMLHPESYEEMLALRTSSPIQPVSLIIRRSAPNTRISTPSSSSPVKDDNMQQATPSSIESNQASPVASTPDLNDESASRATKITRKSHRKSRAGCKNCKTRRIKVCILQCTCNWHDVHLLRSRDTQSFIALASSSVINLSHVA
jgi:hypothetical protein